MPMRPALAIRRACASEIAARSAISTTRGAPRRRGSARPSGAAGSRWAWLCLGLVPHGRDSRAGFSRSGSDRDGLQFFFADRGQGPSALEAARRVIGEHGAAVARSWSARTRSTSPASRACFRSRAKGRAPVRGRQSPHHRPDQTLKQPGSGEVEGQLRHGLDLLHDEAGGDVAHLQPRDQLLVEAIVGAARPARGLQDVIDLASGRPVGADDLRDLSTAWRSASAASAAWRAVRTTMKTLSAALSFAGSRSATRRRMISRLLEPLRPAPAGVARDANALGQRVDALAGSR